MHFLLRILLLIALIALPPIPFLWVGWDNVGSPQGFGAILTILISYGAWIGALGAIVQITGVAWSEWFTTAEPEPLPVQPDLRFVLLRTQPTPINLTINIQQYMLIEPRDVQWPPLTESPTTDTSRIDQDYQERIREASTVSLSILIWGPAESDSDLYRKRVQIRHTLRLLGHVARFSEEWDTAAEESSTWTVNRKEFIQTQLVDWIIILYSSFGSVAETHEIGNLDQLKLKLLVLVNQEHTGSYGARGLLKNLELYNRVVKYTTQDLLSCSLMTRIIQETEIRQIEKWDRMHRSRLI